MNALGSWSLLLTVALAVIFVALRLARSLSRDDRMDRDWIERQWRDELRSAKR